MTVIVYFKNGSKTELPDGVEVRHEGLKTQGSTTTFDGITVFDRHGQPVGQFFLSLQAMK
jgi:hypothetical protein